MKKLFTNLKVAMTLLLLCGVCSAWATDVTFTAGTDVSNSSTITKGNITISMSTLSRDDNYRANSGTDLTVSGATGVSISSIEFTCTASGTNSYGPGKMDLASGQSGAYSYSEKIGSWTGSANSVTFRTSAQVRMTSITVTYTGGEEQPELQSIYITGTATNLSYSVGDEFNPAGLKVMGKYDKGDDKEITTGITWSFNPETLAESTKSVEVTAKAQDKTSAAITVNGLTVSKAPVEITSISNIVNGTYYIKGVRSSSVYYLKFTDAAGSQSGTEAPSTSDAVLLTFEQVAGKSNTFYIKSPKGNYVAPGSSNGKINVSTTPIEVVASQSNSLIRLTSNYGGTDWSIQKNTGGANFGGYKNTQTDITLIQNSITPVKALTSIAVKTAPTTTAYAAGDTFDPTGLIITATYDDNSTEDIEYNNDTKDNFSFNPALDAELATTNTNVEITFNGKSCNQAITVEQIELVSVEVSGTLSKSEYVEGSDFDFTGLVATAKYSNNNERDVTEVATWTIDPAAITFGLTSVKVCATFNDVSGYKDCDITVTEAPKVITEWNKLFGKEYAGNITGFKANEVDWTGTTVFGVTVNVKNGESTNAYLKDDEIRMYNGYTMTLTAPSGRVFTKIETTKGSKADPFTSGITANVGNGEINNSCYSWSGTASSITLTISAKMSFATMTFALYDDDATQDVTITDAGWATACVPFNATVTGAEAYYVKVDGDKLTKTKANVIPAGAGVLLKGTGTATFTISTDNADNTDDNMMLGSLYGETFSKTGYTYYILANDLTNGLGFYYQGIGNEEGKTAKCDAGKAVLAVPTGSSAKSFFSLFDEADGIKEINNAQKQDAQYNLNGVRVNGNYKGIVIINGKKVVK